jgi:hypothetical protein
MKNMISLNYSFILIFSSSIFINILSINFHIHLFIHPSNYIKDLINLFILLLIYYSFHLYFIPKNTILTFHSIFTFLNNLNHQQYSN